MNRRGGITSHFLHKQSPRDTAIRDPINRRISKVSQRPQQLETFFAGGKCPLRRDEYFIVSEVVVRS